MNKWKTDLTTDQIIFQSGVSSFSDVLITRQRLIELNDKLKAIEAVTDRAAHDRSYDGDLIDDIRDIIDGREKC